MISTISTKLYEKLNPDHKNINLFEPTKMQLRNCHGENNPLKGITTLRILFQDNLHTDLNVIISDALTHDFILGYDFIGSRKVRSLTNQYLILSTKRNSRYQRIKLIVKQLEPIQCTIAKPAILEPFEPTFIYFKLDKIDESNENFDRSEERRVGK